MIVNVDIFYGDLSLHLLETGETLQSHMTNLWNGKKMPDTSVASGICHMWNLPITMVSPVLRQPLNLHHDESNPDIVIVMNGGDEDSGKPNTHFTATRPKNARVRKPGHDLKQEDLKIHLKDDKFVAEDLAKSWSIKVAKEHVVTRWGQINKDMLYVETELREISNRSAKLRKMQEHLQRQMVSCGFEVEGVDLSQKFSKPQQGTQTDRPPVTPTKLFEKETPRKSATLSKPPETESNDKPPETTPLHLQPRPPGVVKLNIPDEVEDLLFEENVERSLQKTDKAIKHVKSLLTKVSQQRPILQALTEERELQLEQQKQQQLQEQKQQQEQQQLEKQQQLEQQRQQRHQLEQQQQQLEKQQSTLPAHARLQQEAHQSHIPVKLQLQQQQILDSISSKTVVPEEVDGYVVPETGSIFIINPEGEDQEVTILDEVTTVSEPTVVEDTSAATLKVPQKIGREQTGPVPDHLQDRNYHYCTECPRRFKSSTDLKRHQKDRCGKKDKDFVCQVCGKMFFKALSVKEHHAATHSKIALYTCLICGKDFFYKSHYSVHSKQHRINASK